MVFCDISLSYGFQLMDKTDKLKLPYLGVKDVSEIVGLSIRQIRNIAPRIPKTFQNSSGWQIPPSGVKWIMERSENRGSAPGRKNRSGQSVRSFIFRGKKQTIYGIAKVLDVPYQKIYHALRDTSPGTVVDGILKEAMKRKPGRPIKY